MDELVAHYDEHGTVIGAVARSVMRRDRLWHGTSSVLVRSVDGTAVYLHRRTTTKDVFPGLLDCWAGGVLLAGESPEHSAVRELAEELGITGVPLTPLFTESFDLPDVRSHTFAYQVRWDGPVRHQPEEVADGWWQPVAELRRLVDDETWPIVPDGRLGLRRWLQLQGSAERADQ